MVSQISLIDENHGVILFLFSSYEFCENNDFGKFIILRHKKCSVAVQIFELYLLSHRFSKIILKKYAKSRVAYILIYVNMYLNSYMINLPKFL